MQRTFLSKSKLIFLLLMCLALSLRAIYFKQTADFLQPGSGSDGRFYLLWAEDIVRGNLLGSDVFYALPVYPYFLSLAYLFSAGETFGLILIQILIGSLNCALIYIIGKKLFNNQVGIIAGLIACAYAMFIFYDRMLLPTSLAIFFGLILLLLLLQARDRPGINRWIGIGLFLGLCALTNASLSILAVFILFWIIYEYRNQAVNRRLLFYVSFVLSFSLIIGLVTLRNYIVAGEPVLITAHSGINFYVGNNPRANGLFKPPPYMRATQNGLIEDAKIMAEKISARRLKASEVSNFWFRRALSFAGSRPLDYLKLSLRKLILFWNGKEYIDEIEYFIYNEDAPLFKFPFFKFSFILPLAILGIFLSWPQRIKVMPLYILIFSLMLAVVSFFINSRYRIIIAPYLIMFVAFALWSIWQKFKKKQYRNLALLLPLIFGLYLLVNINPGSASAVYNSTFHYNKGVYLLDRGNYQDAEKQFQAALAIERFDFMSYLGLGNVYHHLQDFPRAIANYEKSLAINPYFYKPYFNLALIYEKMGEDKKAEEMFQKVLHLKPDDCAGHYNLGRLYQKKGLSELALKEYREALTIKPDHWEIIEAIEELCNER